MMRRAEVSTLEGDELELLALVSDRTVSKTPDHAKLNQRLQDFLSSHTATIVEHNSEMVWMLASQ